MNRSPRSRRKGCKVFELIESLESRRMLCAAHQLQVGKVIELRPDLLKAALKVQKQKGTLASSLIGPPADIVWVNRGQASDGFDATFGTSAGLARGVVDAVITMYERMIGSFNYGDGS